MNKNNKKRGIAHVFIGICISIIVFTTGIKESYAKYQTPLLGNVLIESMNAQTGVMVNGYYPKNTKYRVIWSGLYYNPVMGGVTKATGGDNFAALTIEKPTFTIDALGYTISSKTSSIIASTTGTFVFENLTLEDIVKYRHLASFTIGQEKSDFFMYTKSYNDLPMIREDKTSPVISKVFQDGAGWKAEAILSVEASDVESGIPVNAYSWDNGVTWEENMHKVTENGTYSVIARDNVGNYSIAQPFVIQNIDKEKPVIESLKAVTQNPFNGYGQEVQLTAVAKDTKCGLSDMPYSWDNGGTWVADPFCKVSKNGSYTLQVRDKAGNQTSGTVEVTTADADCPEIIKLTQNADNLIQGYTKETRLSIAAMDALSGMHSYPFSYNGGSNWTSRDEFEVKENGIYEILVRDAVHNIGKGSITVSNIDKDGPVIKAIEKEIENEWNGYGTSTNFKVDAKDEKAGLSDTPYSWNKGSSWTSDNGCIFTKNGDYILRMKDVLGNLTEEIVRVDRIDTEKPVIGSVYVSPVNGKSGYAKEAVIEILAKDEEAGLHTKAFSFDAGVSWKEENKCTVSENGYYYIRTRDGVQNTTTGVMQVNCIDRNEPQIQNLELKLNNPMNHYAKTGIIKITAQDLQAGLDDKPYSFNEGQTWTDLSAYTVKYNGNYRVLVRDQLGNIAGKTIQVKSLDETVPSVTITGNPTETVKGNVILTVQAIDRQSGIASLWYQNDETKMKALVDEYWDYNSETKEIEGAEKIKQKVTITANGLYTFYTYDVLENCAEYKIRVTKIDKSSEKGNPENGGEKEVEEEEEEEQEEEEPKYEDEDEVTDEEEYEEKRGETLADEDISDEKVILSKSRFRKEDGDVSGNRTKFVPMSESQNSVERDEIYVKEYMSDAPTKIAEEESISSNAEEQDDNQSTGDGKVPGKKIILTALGILLFLIIVSGVVLWRMGVFKNEEDS